MASTRSRTTPARVTTPPAQARIRLPAPSRLSRSQRVTRGGITGGWYGGGCGPEAGCGGGGGGGGRRPGPGETVRGSDTEVLPGGKGANTAVAAGRLGADVAFLGAIGPDPHGKLLVDSLRSAGVDVSHVRCDERGTGAAYITVTPDGEN